MAQLESVVHLDWGITYYTRSFWETHGVGKRLEVGSRSLS